MHDEITKVCTKCNRDLPLSAYWAQRRGRYGKRSWCKDCSQLHRQQFYAMPGNIQKHNEAKRAWNARNPQRLRGYYRRGYERNRERYLARAAAQYEADPERFKERSRAWQQAHPERRNEHRRRRYAAERSRTVGIITDEPLAAKFAYWGNRCWMCGAPPAEPDHVKPIICGGLHVLANIRPACKPCNSKKNRRWPFPVRGLANWWYAERS